jgi:hypothetical protein
VTFQYLPAPGPLELPFGVRLWAFEPGHSKLLLRGFSDPESETGQTVVDIVFSHVTRMQLDSSYARLTVERGEAIGADRVYTVGPGTGFVVAERLEWAATTLLAHEPSPLVAEDTARLSEAVVGDIYWM